MTEIAKTQSFRCVSRISPRPVLLIRAH